MVVIALFQSHIEHLYLLIHHFIDTYGSNTTTQTTTISDTIEISSGTNNYSAFSQTIDEVSSENELFPYAGGYLTAQVFLLNLVISIIFVLSMG